HIKVADGRLRVSVIDLAKATSTADTRITLSAPLMLGLLAGKATLAAARLSGEVQVTSVGAPGGGDPGALLLLGIIATFRSHLSSKGPRGYVARALCRWFGSSRGRGRGAVAA